MITAVLLKKVSLLVFSTTFFLFSCQQQTEIPQNFIETGIVVKVAVPMGDYRKTSDRYPSIGNLAYLVDKNQDSTEVMIISQRIEKNKKVSIKIGAAMVYGIHNREKWLIVATPSSEKLKYVEIADLIDLSVHHGSMKRILEEWYQGIHPIGDFRLRKWENKNQVNEFIKQRWGVSNE